MTVELSGFGWRHAGRRAWALRGIDLRIERGERVLLLGPSGSGKSTLLAALAGLLAEDSGETEGDISIHGARPEQCPGRVGLVFQDPRNQLIMERVGDEVAFGLENLAWPPTRIWPRVDQVLAEVGFPYGRDRRTNQLSGGQQQRLAIAGVLAGQPDLLLLDEPTANLDPRGAAQVRDTLAKLAEDQSQTMILVEHRVAEALPLVNRVVVLAAGGGIAADGTPEQVLWAHRETLAAQGVWVPGHHRPPTRASNPGERLLAARGLTHRYPGTDQPALAQRDLELAAGQIIAVTGGNGTGKSTMALILGGLLRPTSGEIVTRFAGHPHKWPARDLAQRIGSVFQNPEHQFLTNQVAAELALGPRRAGRSEPETSRIVEELLGRLGLTHLARANPYTLSGGEQRRLAVATALSWACQILILDEPTYGQDLRTWTELVDLLDRLRGDGTGIIMVTHDLDLVETLADQTLNLDFQQRCVK